MNPKYKFPFFGIPFCFEYVSIDIIFKETPTEAQRVQIKTSAPSLISNFYEEKEENCMAAESHYITHYGIAKTYPTKDGSNPDDYDNDATQSEDFVAADSQITAFYTAIERWLQEVHEISPIALVYYGGNEDEKKVVELSDWGIWSMKQFNSISPYLESTIVNFDYDSIKAEIVSNVLHFIGEHSTSELDEKNQKYLYPGYIELEAFKKDNIEPLKSITNPIYLNRTIKLFNEAFSEEHQKNIEKHAILFLSFESKIDEKKFKRLNEALFTYCTDINSETFKKIASKITCEDFIFGLAREAWLLVEKDKYIESIPIFEKLLLSPVEPDIETGFYNNILLVFQKNKTGLPTDVKRNLSILKRCLPKASNYPCIFYNACGIYTEIEQYDKAYEMVKEALFHYFDRDFMLRQIENNDVFKKFREQTKVLELLKTHKLEPKENPKPRFISDSIGISNFDMHFVYNDGYTTSFSCIILINGHVNINGEFKNVYKALLDEYKTFQEQKEEALRGIKDDLLSKQEQYEEEQYKDEENFLIIVNGHLIAKSITEDKGVYILVEGEVHCDQITHKEIITQKKTEFDPVYQSYDKDIEKLIFKIRKAFKDVTLDGGIGLSEAQIISDPQNLDLQVERSVDEKTDWENIPISKLNLCRDSLISFDAKGMQFHIPRFMIAALETGITDEETDFGINVAIALTSVSKISKHQLDSQDQFSNLTEEQRDAVIAFLAHLLEDDDYEFAKKDIRIALDNYWLKVN